MLTPLTSLPSDLGGTGLREQSFHIVAILDPPSSSKVGLSANSASRLLEVAHNPRFAGPRVSSGESRLQMTAAKLRC
jgi:hypothetical protein